MSISTVEDKFLNTKEAASLVNIHPVTLRRFAETKVLPAKKIGGHWRFSKEKLMEFLKNNA